jgi:hypothetical protein
MDDVKTERSRWLGKSSVVVCLLTERHPALRRREFASGFFRERGNLSLLCKGRNASGDPASMRVPKNSTGTDRLVVAVKVSNVTGAKGSDYSTVNVDQPGMGGVSEHRKAI